MILFTDFCAWALEHALDLDEEDDWQPATPATGASTGSALAGGAAAPGAPAASSPAAEAAEAEAAEAAMALGAAPCAPQRRGGTLFTTESFFTVR